MDAPPSRTEWALEGELRGHTPAETIAYLDWVSDWTDQQQERRRSLPAGFVPGDQEPRAIGFLRRVFRR
jgi:hypothetical protein